MSEQIMKAVPPPAQPTLKIVGMAEYVVTSCWFLQYFPSLSPLRPHHLSQPVQYKHTWCCEDIKSNGFDNASSLGTTHKHHISFNHCQVYTSFVITHYEDGHSRTAQE